MTIFLLSKHQ